MRSAVVAAALFAVASMLQVSAGPVAVEDRAEKLARMAQRIDVQAAATNVIEWENCLRYALANRNTELTKKARNGVKFAKRDLAKAKAKGVGEYMDRARRAAASDLADRPDKDENNTTNRENLSPGEHALERIRHAGPLFIGGVLLEDNLIGVPEVQIFVGNSSDRTVDAYDVEIQCWDAFGEPVGHGDDNIMAATCQTPVGSMEVGTAKWMLAVQDTTTRVAVRITRIKPAYGNLWEQTREEAERSPGAIVQAELQR